MFAIALELNNKVSMHFIFALSFKMNYQGPARLINNSKMRTGLVPLCLTMNIDKAASAHNWEDKQPIRGTKVLWLVVQLSV